MTVTAAPTARWSPSAPKTDSLWNGAVNVNLGRRSALLSKASSPTKPTPTGPAAQRRETACAPLSGPIAHAPSDAGLRIASTSAESGSSTAHTM